MEENHGNMSPKQQLTLEQKEKLRKVSHTAIERKRRERIANCMLQLKTMVPSNRNQDYLQKLTILENTVKYIRELQEKVDQKEFFSSFYARPAMAVVAVPLPYSHPVPISPNSTQTNDSHPVPISPKSTQTNSSKVMDIDNLLSLAKETQVARSGIAIKKLYCDGFNQRTVRLSLPDAVYRTLVQNIPVGSKSPILQPDRQRKLKVLYN
ncbi:hypothetical protein HDV01_005516 [Terramyces sp. JEL0728]|nr:hypothetical protein HDV01_005516 [Terramyces sp. JEL0728]